MHGDAVARVENAFVGDCCYLTICVGLAGSFLASSLRVPTIAVRRRPNRMADLKDAQRRRGERPQADRRRRGAARARAVHDGVCQESVLGESSRRAGLSLSDHAEAEETARCDELLARSG